MAAGSESVDGLVNLYRSERISRRVFIWRLGALGLTATTIGGVLAACDTGGGGETQGDAQDTATPRRGGTIRFELEDFFSTDTADATQNFSSFGLIHGGNVYESLVTLDKSFEIVSAKSLAEEVERNEDASVWTFRLRDGVEFHDGRPLSTQDVVFSFQRLFLPETASAWLSLVSGSMKSPENVVARDSRTVEFTLPQPNAYWPQVISTTAFPILQEGTTDFSTPPPGTGPFVWRTYVQGERAEWDRHENYWQDGLPYLDGVFALRVPDTATKVQSLTEGVADLIDATGFNALPIIDQTEGVQKLVAEGSFWISLALDTQVEPFSDVRVVQAIKMAIDRERVRQQVYQGEAIVTPDIVLGPPDPNYPADLQPIEYDVGAAQQLLADAGYPNGFDMEVFTNPLGAARVDQGVVMVDMLQEAGINATLTQVTPDRHFAEIFVQAPSYMAWHNFEVGAVITTLWMTSDATVPETHFGNPTFDAFVYDAIADVDPASSKEKFGEAMRVLIEESGQVIPVHGNSVFVAKSTLHGVEVGYAQGQVCDLREAFFS